MPEEHRIFQIKHLPRGIDKNQDTQVASVLRAAAEQPGVPAECLHALARRRSDRDS